MSDPPPRALSLDGATNASSPLARLGRVAWPQLRLAAVEVAIVTAPIAAPVRGSFGAMSARVSLLVRVRDGTGGVGHGEVWANFPEGGAQYKAHLLRRYVAPLLVGRTWASPWAAWDALEVELARLVLQSGDFGAFAQVCAGVDQAIWDLYCRRVGAPLWSLAGGTPHVNVYASGIGPEQVAATIREQEQAGHTRFKIKLGFGEAVDRSNLEAALAALPSAGVLLTDANQGWSVDEARAWLAVLAAQRVGWCEEPVRADVSLAAWTELTQATPDMRVAAGENLRGIQAFTDLATTGGVRVIQPDPGKWGGITGALRLHAALPPDVWLCPHWLGGAVGLAASLQLVGALQGMGPVEVDVNPNPLRTQLLGEKLDVHAGSIVLTDRPGIVSTPSHAQLDWR